MKKSPTALCYQKDKAGKNSFRYVPSSATDIRKTIARAKKRITEEAAKIPKNVRSIKVAK